MSDQTVAIGSPDADAMQAFFGLIDRHYNPDSDNKTVGICILTFGFHAPGVSNYICNAERANMILSLRETADRLEKNQLNQRVPFNE